MDFDHAVLIRLRAKKNGVWVEQRNVVLHKPHVKGVPEIFSNTGAVASNVLYILANFYAAKLPLEAMTKDK